MGKNNADHKGLKNPNASHGFAGLLTKRPSFYNSWQNMKQRCLNKKHPSYKDYGGRGIRICKEWHNIIDFYRWVSKSGWKEGLSIDRIDNNGDYEPNNCRWVTVEENSRKKRTTKISALDADRIREKLKQGVDAYDLAKEYSVSHGSIWFIQNNFTHVKDGECSRKLRERNLGKKV